MRIRLKAEEQDAARLGLEAALESEDVDTIREGERGAALNPTCAAR